MSNNPIGSLIARLTILLVDDNAYMRKVTRMMLVNLGVKSIVEAGDGASALEAVRNSDPDIMLLEWDLPILNGMEVIRFVRSPKEFARPDLPTIMLTDQATRKQVNEALRMGVHEFLVKPTSALALRARLASIILKPRSMIKDGNNYRPEPRVKGTKDLRVF
jgi:two-component system, chemotaxis family, chemotaxis protein CheY